MNAKADGGLRQRLINPISIRLSAIAKDKAPEPVFSVAAALKDPRRILIITDAQPGSLFLSASKFWAIRHRYPEAQVSLLAPSHKAYIAKEIPFVDDVIVYKDFLLPLGNKHRDVIRTLQKKDFDIAFCLTSVESFCPAYLCYKSRAHLRVGFQREDFPFFNVRIVPHKETFYELERLALLLRTLGIPQLKERVSWSVSKEGAQKLRERYLVGGSTGERFVAFDVSSGAGDRPTNRQLLGIAEGSTALPNTRALVFFDYEKRKFANQIKELLGNKVLLFQTDDLPKVVALLEACVQLISCHTDLFQLGVAMGMPVAGIFSSRDVLRWVPSDRDHVDILAYETIKNWSPYKLNDAIRRNLSSLISKKMEVSQG